MTTSKVKDPLNHINDFRELLFVKLALSTSGRLQTILQITKKDINLTRGSVLLRDLKNNSTYTGFLNDDVKTILATCIKNLKADDSNNRVGTHTFRHTFASHLSINGTPIFTIQKLMNHRDIKMTMQYTKLAPDSGMDMVKELYKFS